jgi:hypothetical protein
MTDPETYDGYPNRETWTVSLLLNNDRDWQSHVHHLLRLIDWDIALAGQVILVGAKNLKRVKARYAGTVVRDALDGLLTPKEIVSLFTNKFLEVTSLELTERQYQAIKDIGSMWRVDWGYLGAEFLTALEDS